MSSSSSRSSAGALVALLAVLGAACPGSAPEPAPRPGPDAGGGASAQAADVPNGCDPQPVPPGDFELLGDPRACIGGRIVLSTNAYPTHLSYYGPERDYDLAFEYADMLFNQLVVVHRNTLQIVPELATVETAPDLSSYTFRIDPDAKWSDGKPITAQDVIATWDVMKSPAVVETALTLLFDAAGFSRPEALDERTVVFRTSSPSWRNILMFEDFYVLPAHAVDPKTYLEAWRWAPPVTSGPYALGHHETGKVFSFKRRPDFWGWGKRQFVGTCNFDEVVWKVIADDDADWEHAKAGDIDFHAVLKAQRWVEDVPAVDAVRKGWMRTLAMAHRQPQAPAEMAMNLESPLFRDVRVRKALAYLFDREYLHDQLFFDLYVSKDSYFPNTIYENPSNEKMTFDADKGLALLREAGWVEKDADGTLIRDGRRFEFTYNYIHATRERIYTPVQETFRKYGIKMDLQLIQPSAWIKLSQEKDFDMIYANWGPQPFPNPRETWHSSSADLPDTSNIVKFADPEADRLIEAYEKEPDLRERVRLLRRLDGLIHAQHPYLLNWYSDRYRMAWWDKFGMPEWITWATEDSRYTIWRTWWWQPERAARLERAKAAGASLPLQATESTWWKDGPGAKWFALPDETPADGGAAPATGPATVVPDGATAAR